MPKISPSIDSVGGFQVAGVHAGLEKGRREGFHADRQRGTDCVCAGVFHAQQGQGGAGLAGHGTAGGESEFNSGGRHQFRVSANACTGSIGLKNARTTADLAADALGIGAEQVLVMSTGVIGTHLPMDKIGQGLRLSAWRSRLGLAGGRRRHHDNRYMAETGFRRVDTAGGSYTIAGIVKGAGMIAPNMATMLSVFVTDAQACACPMPKRALRSAAQQSYNRIVVDGDTSTNDTVLLLANGDSGVQVSDDARPCGSSRPP